MSDGIQYGINLVVYGEAKHGKALALDTPIPTPSGWSSIGDLKVGDALFNDHGEITHVVALGPVWATRPCRRVDVMGDSVIADAAHLWKASRPKGDNTGTMTIVETDDLVVSEGVYRKLPWTPALQLPDVDLPVHPYIVGAWLGDGSARDGSYISGVDARKLDVLRRCCDLYGEGEIREEDGRYTAYLPKLKIKLTEIGARIALDGRDARKSVPISYMRSGLDQRREFLAGLIDTDGSVTPKVVTFSTSNREIADAVAEISCSLGIRAHVTGPYVSSYTKNGQSHITGEDYSVTLRGVISAHNVTHRTDWQQIIPSSRHKQYYRLSITNVEKVESVPVRCIQVDDLHGMFLAGRTMIPTHNSWFGDTAPAPRLVIDAEGGSRFTPSRKKLWDPAQPPPEPSESWDTAMIMVHKYRQVQQAYQWLDSGKHPFRSVILDSLSDIQQRIIDDIAGVNQMTTQNWGELLRNAMNTVRNFRDLTTHPTHPLDAVVFITMAEPVEGVQRPLIQGKLGKILPYLVDLCSYLYVVQLEDGTPVRRLLTSPFPGYITGERLGGALGPYLDNPDITTMLGMIRDRIAGTPAATAQPPEWNDLQVIATTATTENESE